MNSPAQDAAEEQAALAAWKASRDEESLPGAMVERLVVRRESPIVIWREHRGLPQGELARRTRCSPSYLSEIESGARDGSMRLRRRIAAALGVDLDDLEWRRDD